LYQHGECTVQLQNWSSGPFPIPPLLALQQWLLEESVRLLVKKSGVLNGNITDASTPITRHEEQSMRIVLAA
jgi:hypothetical protein